MGIYINPGNETFRVNRNGKYVDKSALIGVVNRTVGLPNKLSCISRPRRFGKSYAAQMLCAYYCTGCDSAPCLRITVICLTTRNARLCAFQMRKSAWNMLALYIG